jgi:hypothetical protein
MKRLLALTLLTTAISVPAFAETSLNTGASTGIGIDAGVAKIGADVDTSNSVNTSHDSEDVGSTGTSSTGMSSSMSSDTSADTSADADTSSSTSARTAAEADSNTSASTSAQAITGENLARNDVVMIQQALRQEGLYNGTADGVWGPRTASALMQFQQQNQLGATGQLNTNTLDQLGVELGASGSSKTSTSGRASGSTTGGY